MKRTLCLILALLLLSGLFGCAKAEEEGLLPADLAGWWVQPLSYTAKEESLPHIFFLDGENACWTGYDDYGNADGKAGSVSAEKGLLSFRSLDGELLAVLTVWDGTTLTDSEGYVCFLRQGAVSFAKKTENGTLTGYWYKNGDPTGDYYCLKGDFTYEKSLGGAVSANIWSATENQPCEADYMGVIMGDVGYTVDTVVFQTDFFEMVTVCEGRKAFLVQDAFENRYEYYLHESALFDSVTETLCRLCLREWADNPETPDFCLRFYTNRGVVLYRSDSEEFETGLYSVDGENHGEITFADGRSEAFSYGPESGRLTLGALTFERVTE